MVAMLREFDERANQRMPDPHWHPMALGVDPPYQRRGYGRALGRSGIHRANGANKPIYLEAETDANTTFYNKPGFTVLGEMTIEAIHLPFPLLIHNRRPPTPDRNTGARMCRWGQAASLRGEPRCRRPTRDRWSSFREVRRTVLSAAGVPTE